MNNLTPSKFEIAINTLWPGEKLQQRDKRWREHTASFHKELYTIDSLVKRVAVDGCAFAPVMRGGYRSKANFISAQHIGLDDDRGTAESSLQALAEDPFIAAHAAFLYETPSSTPECPKSRIVFVLDQPFSNAEEYRIAQEAMWWRFGFTDSHVKEPARFFYGRPQASSLKPANILYGDVLQEEVIEPYLAARGAGDLAHITTKSIADVIPQGDRNSSLFSMAGTMRRRGFTVEAITEALAIENLAKCVPPLGNEEVEAIAKGVTRYPVGLNTPANEPGDGLPIIQGNYRQVRNISEDCVDALVRANDPAELFVRSGVVARVRPDEKGRPIIDNINESILANRLTRTADFTKVTKKGVQACPPPQEVVKDILAMGQWPFPALAGVVEVPTLRPDGSILTTPGFDKSTGLMYLPDPSLTVPQIPEYPSVTDIQHAVAIVDDVLFDFPFVDPASRANAWAVLLTTMVRHAIQGRVPLCLCDAPKAGTGKGLFAGIISVIATGRLAAMFSAPGHDDEWRKQLTSALLIGSTMIIIDNLEGRLDSASLSRALTAPIWADRILSTNTMVHLPNNATWLATGNNIALGGDMPRRCYLVRMDARHPNPWERTGFRHPRLEEYVTENRGELVAALLTIIRGWYAASCPVASVPPFGGFEVWAETTGGILAYAGVEGFLANLPVLHSQLDQDTPVWATFFEAWHDLHHENPVMVATVTDSMKENGDFVEALPDNLKEEFVELMAKRKQTFNQKLGGALRARKDSVYPNGLQLIRATDDPNKKVARWAVVALELAGTSPGSPQNFEPTAGSCGEQQPLPPRETRTDNSSGATGGTTPRNSPQSCLVAEEISSKSPQDPWDVIDDENGV